MQIDYRPRDLTHRCQGCGEWLTAAEVPSHCRTGGHDAEGNPWPEPCGPIDEVPRDDITIWLRDQDEAGCHEAADELDRMRTALKTIERSGTPGAIIVAKRDDVHACGWCRGILTPCPVETARKALEKK